MKTSSKLLSLSANRFVAEILEFMGERGEKILEAVLISPIKSRIAATKLMTNSNYFHCALNHLPLKDRPRN